MTTSTPNDPTALKHASRVQWNESAPGWDRHAPQLRAWLAPATAAMLERADVRPGARVLDVAAGAGDQSLDIARRVGPGGRVLATDLSPAILALARANFERAGLSNVETLEADGEALPLPSAEVEAGFDAVLCRLGLMFFPDPLQGLREMHRVLRPGGRACTLVFGAPEHNPCITLLMRTALKHAGLPPRDPFQPGSLLSLGQPGQAEQLFRAAGFREVLSTAIAAPFALPSAAHYLDFVRSSASPVQLILARLPPAAAEAAWQDMARQLAQFEADTGWLGPNELLLTSGIH